MFNGRGWNTVRNNRGNALWSTNLELRFPVAPGMLSLDAFYDIAAVKDSLQDFAHLSQDDFYYSFGAGLRISVPQFPLKFLWAFP
jgi:outer membrane protein insertion porin family